MIDLVELFHVCLYIEQHLEANLSLLFLARTVGLSRFRFHRVFKAWRGETLHDFVTRMRMERAAFELAYPMPHSNRRSIKAIAFASGYKSLSSFSHAFSAYADMSPRDFRNRALQRRPAARAFASDRLGSFSITVGDQPARQIALFDPVLDPVTAGAERQHLMKLARVANEAPAVGDRYVIGLLPNVFARAYCDGTASARAARMSCAGVEHHDWRAATGPRTTMGLNAGRYAVIAGPGSVVDIYRAWRRHFEAWLASTGECPKPGRLFLRFSSTAEGGDTIALYLPLEDRAPEPAPLPTRRRPPAAEATLSMI